MSTFINLLSLIGSLGLFLFGMKTMSEGHDITRSYAIEDEINALRTQVRNDNLQSISSGEYDYKLGAFYIDYINGLEKLADYILNVVQCKARQSRI